MSDKIHSGQTIDSSAEPQVPQQQPDFGSYEYPRRSPAKQVYEQAPDQVLNQVPNSDYYPREFDPSQLADWDSRHYSKYSNEYPCSPNHHTNQHEDFHWAPLEAWGAKSAYLGSLGRLVPTKDALKAELLKAGDIGEQLVRKMTLMEKQGWAIGNAFLYFPEPKAGWAKVIADRDANLHYGSQTAKLVASLGTLGSLWHGASMDDKWKFVRLNGNNAIIHSLGLGSVHGKDPIKLMTPLLGHELSHNDGILKVFTTKEIDALSQEERLSYAKRLMITEARAHLVHSAIYERLKTNSYGLCDLKQYVKDGKLGSFIWNKYVGGGIYRTLNTMTSGEADELVSDYFSRHFGELIDPKTGNYRKFDINAGLDQQIGRTQFDDQLMEQMKKVDYTHVPPALAGMRKIAVRGGQALLGGAALVATADLVHGFSKGADVGMSKVARSYSSLAGYEVGSALVGAVFKANTVGRFWGAIAGGVVGSSIMDASAGKQVETYAKDAVRNLGKTLNIAYLAPEEAKRST